MGRGIRWKPQGPINIIMTHSVLPGLTTLRDVREFDLSHKDGIVESVTVFVMPNTTFITNDLKSIKMT
jgi:hypothetical protein